MYAVKSIKQYYSPNTELTSMMETFRQMVNYCIKLGLENNIFTLKRFSSNYFHKLQQYDIQSYYKLTAISQACARLSQLKHSIRKGKIPRSPYVQKPYLVSCYGFKINGLFLSLPIGNKKYANIVLNEHTISQLKEVEPRSFVITPTSLSISIRKKIKEITPENVIGIDRNLRNVTIGNSNKITMYNTDKLPKLAYRTRKITSSFKRNDHRIKQIIYSKLENRKSQRTKQYLHLISKDIVQKAIQSKSMIVFEDLKGIRKLYRKGNYQGKNYRSMMNSWSFYELQRQIQYKSAWEGVPVRFVSPVRTSILCPICGNRTQEDRYQHRQLWCSSCKRSMDRDVVAAMNISYKGLQRFCNPNGLSVEAMRGNLDNVMPVILRVDGSKLSQQLRGDNGTF